MLKIVHGKFTTQLGVSLPSKARFKYLLIYIGRSLFMYDVNLRCALILDAIITSVLSLIQTCLNLHHRGVGSIDMLCRPRQ